MTCKFMIISKNIILFSIKYSLKEIPIKDDHSNKGIYIFSVLKDCHRIEHTGPYVLQSSKKLLK